MVDHIENCSKCPTDVQLRYLPASTGSAVMSQNESCTVEQKPATFAAIVASSSLTSTESVSASSSSSSQMQRSIKTECKVKHTVADDKHGATFSGTMSCYVDTVTAAEHDYIHELLARAIFASGAPLTITENKHWKLFFAKMRPAYVPPSRYVVTSRLLDAEHACLRDKVSEKVPSADMLALTCDG